MTLGRVGPGWNSVPAPVNVVRRSVTYLSQRPFPVRFPVPESVVLNVGQAGIEGHVQRYEFRQRRERTAPDFGQLGHTADDELLELVQADERFAVQTSDGVRVQVEIGQGHVSDLHRYGIELIAVQI